MKYSPLPHAAGSALGVQAGAGAIESQLKPGIPNLLQTNPYGRNIASRASHGPAFTL